MYCPKCEHQKHIDTDENTTKKKIGEKTITCPDCKSKHHIKTKELLGCCAVDSGQILLVDPCYLNAWKDGEADDKQSHYGQCCDLTLGSKGGGQILISNIAGTGVVTSTGWGDGNYPVYAEYNEEGRVARVTIDFLTE